MGLQGDLLVNVCKSTYGILMIDFLAENVFVVEYNFTPAGYKFASQGH